MTALLAALAFLKQHGRSVAVVSAVIALCVALHFAIRAHDRAQYNRGFNVAFNRGWQREQIQVRSIDTLMKALAQKNAETEERAAAYAGSKSADASNTASNDAKQKADAARVATLDGIAQGAALKPGCTVPPALLAALEGL